jgi:hypothetical protein
VNAGARRQEASAYFASFRSGAPLPGAAAHDLDLALGVGHLARSPLDGGLVSGRKLGDHFGECSCHGGLETATPNGSWEMRLGIARALVQAGAHNPCGRISQPPAPGWWMPAILQQRPLRRNDAKTTAASRRMAALPAWRRHPRPSVIEPPRRLHPGAARGAKRTFILPVAVPSHTPLLSEATEQFRTLLHEACPRLSRAGYRLLSEIDGDTIYDMETGIDKLARQISTTIDWAACVVSCRSAGAEAVLELGPGTALSHMASALFPNGRARAAEEFRTVAGLHTWLQRAMG